jgi:hypothetical protein
VQAVELLGELVEVGVVAGVVCVVEVEVEVEVEVGVELVCVVAGAVAVDVADCRLATLLELCDELPHAPSASVQATMSAARILMCRCFGRGISRSFPSSTPTARATIQAADDTNS